MRVTPMNDNVLVERDVAEERKSPGGVIMPKTNQKAPTFCTVIAIGQKCDLPPTIKEGARVIVSTYAGVDIDIDEDPYVIVKDVDILGRVQGEAKLKINPPKKATK